MSDINELVTRYLATWNEPDAEKRRTEIESLWASDAPYIDPLAAVEGHEGVAAVIEAARGQFPGFRFKLLGDPDSHHNIARFRWGLVPEAGGDPVAIGFDVAVIDDNGRLKGVYGFLDLVPGS